MLDSWDNVRLLRLAAERHALTGDVLAAVATPIPPNCGGAALREARRERGNAKIRLRGWGLGDDGGVPLCGHPEPAGSPMGLGPGQTEQTCRLPAGHGGTRHAGGGRTWDNKPTPKPTPKPAPTKTYTYSADDLRILWAAMQAMVADCHAPQDNLTPEQWERAQRMLDDMDAEINRLASEKGARS